MPSQTFPTRCQKSKAVLNRCAPALPSSVCVAHVCLLTTDKCLQTQSSINFQTKCGIQAVTTTRTSEVTASAMPQTPHKTSPPMSTHLLQLITSNLLPVQTKLKSVLTKSAQTKSAQAKSAQIKSVLTKSVTKTRAATTLTSRCLRSISEIASSARISLLTVIPKASSLSLNMVRNSFSLSSISHISPFNHNSQSSQVIHQVAE